ncbi:unnamed protein product [Rotaria magnacalcarata]|uniref:Uncharacterized protein n=2 Tax=Rotaria magnacalcarata TaxID=392030 RepID=A0A8S2NZQ7_9BILA|nr:unnamed protein product [Rotaria magnacalcarata]
MYRFSRKVNQRRRIRQIQRQLVRHIIVPDNELSDDNSSESNSEQFIQMHDQEEESYEETFRTTINNNFVSFPSCINHLDQDTDWASEDEYEEDKRSLYSGSPLSVTKAVHLITNFYLDINLDKQKVNGLLRLIKRLLPKPNLLPSTLKRVNQLLHLAPLTTTTLLCSDCYQSCKRAGFRSKTCANPSCSTSFRQRRSTEVIEIVRFDVRSQIQWIMNRNVAFINKSRFFPPNDICFGEQYQNMSDRSNNTITLIVHSDGAPIVRSSKQSIWPCFASITEIPPPLREFQSNIIILALWLSKKKPDVNIFLTETVNDLSLLIHDGTSIFIGAKEYKIQLRTQFFISDLPAKALFCCTTYFNGYSACTFCCSRGIWSPDYKKVLYPYENNDLTARTHDSYLKAAREAIRKSNGGKEVAVEGIKGHIPYLINRWCSLIDKKTILAIDKKLQQLRIPHNMKVVFLESITMVSQWKAKNSRLFVLHVGVPIMLNHLPNLLFSHFVIYSLAIKLLYSPETKEEVLFAERLIEYYCQTAPLVHDPSIEIFSLHAHLHLSYQVRLHGGLAHMSAFAFESLIRYIKNKAHGSCNLASQIAYWVSIQHAVKSNKVNLREDCLMNFRFHSIMTQNNVYNRSYLTKRKTTEQNESYHVVIFPCDNSFSVVKSKQCSPSEKDGFVLVQSGGKKFIGFIFETGSFQVCSKSADRLSQKQHEDIESDYERSKENVAPKDIISNTTEYKTLNSLKDVPFTIDSITNNHEERSPRRTISNTTNMNHVTTPIRRKPGSEKNWQQNRNPNCLPNNDPTIATTTMSTSITTCTDPTTVSLSTSNNLNVHRRPMIDSSPSQSQVKKKKKSNNKKKYSSSSSDSSDDEDIIRSNEQIRTPQFRGRNVIHAERDTTTTTPTHPEKLNDQNNILELIEKKYLIPLFLSQQKLEKMITSTYKNQIKIQKALSKKQVFVSMEEPTGIDSDERNFSSSVIYKAADNELGIDLLKIPATKEKANLYVTTLIQLIYSIEELAELQPAQTYDDERYKLIKDAVRVKFKLTEEQLEQMFNEWLREVFLAKRRVAVAKLKAIKDSD